MTDVNSWDIAPAIRALIDWGWQFLNLQVPGTPMTFASIFMGVTAICVSISIVNMVFGFGDPSDSWHVRDFTGTGRGESGRGGGKSNRIG